MFNLQTEELRIRRSFLDGEIINYANPDIPLQVNHILSKTVKQMQDVSRKLEIDQTYTAYKALLL